MRTGDGNTGRRSASLYVLEVTQSSYAQSISISITARADKNLAIQPRKEVLLRTQSTSGGVLSSRVTHGVLWSAMEHCECDILVFSMLTRCRNLTVRPLFGVALFTQLSPTQTKLVLRDCATEQ